MKKTITSIFGISLVLLSTMTLAQDSDRLGMGFKIGTTGIGLEFTSSLTDTINLRGGYNYAEFDFDVEETDINYKSDFDKSSFSLMLDWHPGDAGFRISAGVFAHSANEISAVATPVNGTYEINGTIYNASDFGTLDGDIGFEKTTPYIGIGWGNASKGGNGFGFSFDIGILMQDTPSVALAVNNCTAGATICAQLDTDVQAEIAALDDDLSDFDFWPVANIGFTFQF